MRGADYIKKKGGRLYSDGHRSVGSKIRAVLKMIERVIIPLEQKRSIS